MESLYANREWAKSEIESLKSSVKESKAIGVEARKLASADHVCNYKVEIEAIREEQIQMAEELGHWRFFKRLFFVLISVMLATVLGAAGTVVSYAVSSAENMSDIKHSVISLDTRHRTLVQQVDEQAEKTAEDQQKQLENFKEVLKQEFSRIDIEKPKRGKRVR